MLNELLSCIILRVGPFSSMAFLIARSNGIAHKLVSMLRKKFTRFQAQSWRNITAVEFIYRHSLKEKLT